jgi:hypothetical protein
MNVAASVARSPPALVFAFSAPTKRLLSQDRHFAIGETVMAHAVLPACA